MDIRDFMSLILMFLIVYSFFGLHFRQGELQAFHLCKLQIHELSSVSTKKKAMFCLQLQCERKINFVVFNNSNRGDVLPCFQGMLSSKGSNKCTCTVRFVNVVLQHNKFI